MNAIDLSMNPTPESEEGRIRAAAEHNKPGSVPEPPSKSAADPGRTIKLSLPDEEESPGTMIGRYKLLEKLGEGGFGEVYVAEQRAPVKRRVALKIIKLGMDTRQVVARFEAERQALALMDHPNIARALDAGATDAGRPFFVMELVKGIPITRYCDQEGLGAKDRLDLFIQVCHAIQHAHQKGIIHRDIKPSNILVTLHDGVPVPKVIDFGIAKATQGELTDKTVYTQFQQFIGTPAYMSPEQAEMSGLDVDTRSDIYSLGVLLYELLTSRTPFDAKELMASGIDGMRKTIREREPLRPSTRLIQTLSAEAGPRDTSTGGEEQVKASSRRLLQAKETIALLRGDLDWIVMKCLEKDRARRYDTANGLAADIQRHLNNEPVVARPPSALYRFQKTFRRNRLLSTAGAAVAFALILGIGLSTREAIRATRAERAKQALLESEQRARQEATRAQGEALVERDNSRRNLYAANINLAGQAWNESNLGKTRRLLARTTPATGEEDSRGWEWRYLWGQTRSQDIAEAARFGGGVFQLAFVNGDRNVTVGLLGAGSEERGSLLFDFGATQLSNRRVFGRGILGVSAFIPSRNWLVCSRPGTNGDFNLSVLDFATLDEVARQPIPGVLKTASVSRDGGRLAAYLSRDDPRSRGYQPGEEVRIWQCGDWQHVSILQSNGNSAAHFGALSFLGAGDRLAIGWSSGRVSIHESATGNKLREFVAHSDGVTAMAVSPTTGVLATGAGYSDPTVKLWNPDNGEAVGELKGHQGWIAGLAFSSDGALLASASADQTVRLWDTKTWKEIAVLRGHEDEVYCLAFSSDGKRLLTGGKDGSVRLWQVPPAPRPPSLRVLREPCGAFSVSPDSRHAVTLGSDYVLWDIDSGEKIETLTALHGYRAGYGFSPDGRELLAGGRNGKVRVWNFDRDALTELDAGGGGDVLEVTKLGKTHLVVTVQDGTSRTQPVALIKTWDYSNWKLVHEFEYNVQESTASAVSPKGYVVTGHEDGSVTLWGMGFSSAGTNFPAHRRKVVGVAFTPDERILATAGEEGTAKLWDLATHRGIVTLKGHLTSVHGLAISPDGRRLATAGGGRESIKLWDIQTHQELITLPSEVSMIERLAFSPDGNKIVGMSGEGEILIWRAPSWEEIKAATAPESGGSGTQ